MTAIIVFCETCEATHVAEYHHEGSFGEGPVFEAVCPIDLLADYYTEWAKQ